MQPNGWNELFRQYKVSKWSVGVFIFKVKLELDISVNGLRSFCPLVAFGSPSEAIRHKVADNTVEYVKNSGLCWIRFTFAEYKSFGNKRTSNKWDCDDELNERVRE